MPVLKLIPAGGFAYFSGWHWNDRPDGWAPADVGPDDVTGARGSSRSSEENPNIGCDKSSPPAVSVAPYHEFVARLTNALTHSAPVRDGAWGGDGSHGRGHPGRAGAVHPPFGRGHPYEVPAAKHTHLPKFLEARVPLPSSLNMGEWRRALVAHTDATLADHIDFGFPSNYSATRVPTPTFKNHNEERAYARHITDYCVPLPSWASGAALWWTTLMRHLPTTSISASHQITLPPARPRPRSRTTMRNRPMPATSLTRSEPSSRRVPCSAPSMRHPSPPAPSAARS